MRHKRQAMATYTYNIQLQPSEQLYAHWFGLLTEAKRAYNACTACLVANGTGLGLKAVHDNVYGWMRKEYPSLPAQSIIKIYKEAAASLKSIRRNKHVGAKVPVKKHLSMHLDKRLYGRMTAEGITLSDGVSTYKELVPYVLYPKVTEMFMEYMHLDPLLFFRDGRMYLSVPFEVPDKPVNGDVAVGVDLGLRQLFVTSEGFSFSDTKYLKARREVRHVKSELKAKQTRAARRKLRRLKRRERNLSDDMCKRAAKVLLESTEANVLVLEDLRGMKRKTSRSKEGWKRKKHNSRMSQVPFAAFKDTLTHKAPRYGKSVETVSALYTSQTDSRTGLRDGERRGRRYICKDGVVLDADWNAAVNIVRRSKHPVSSRLPVDGGLTPLTGRPLSTGRMCNKSTDRKSRGGRTNC